MMFMTIGVSALPPCPWCGDPKPSRAITPLSCGAKEGDGRGTAYALEHVRCLACSRSYLLRRELDRATGREEVRLRKCELRPDEVRRFTTGGPVTADDAIGAWEILENDEKEIWKKLRA